MLKLFRPTSAAFVVLMALAVAVTPQASAADSKPAITLSLAGQAEMQATNLPGHFTFKDPPEGFDPLTASDADLAEYGFPPRPDAQLAPAHRAAWERAMKALHVHVKANLIKTDKHYSNSGPSTPNPVWSGYVFSNGGPYGSPSPTTWGPTSMAYVMQDFVVPWVNEVNCVAGVNIHDCGATIIDPWVGLDGWGNEELAQAGVESLVNSPGAPAAWYEWVPDGAYGISNFTPLPGDEVQVVLYSANGSSAYLWMEDLTTGQYINLVFFPPSPTYNLQGISAEWIIEGNPPPFFAPIYVNNTFAYNASGTPFNLQSANTVGLYMVDSDDNTLLMPSLIDPLDPYTFVGNYVGPDAGMSPNGTTLPPASKITDENGTVWTVSGGVAYQNGGDPQGCCIATMLFYGGTIYVQQTPASGSGWFEWENGWVSLSSNDPRKGTPSTNGTTIPQQSSWIVDSSGNVWTMPSISDVIYENGNATTGSGNHLLVLYHNGTVYAENTGDAWYKWNGGWVYLGQGASLDPRASTPSASGTAIPLVSWITDASGNVWTMPSSTDVIYENGTATTGGGGHALVLYYDGTVYADNTGGAWYKWNPASGWVYLPTGDPRAASLSPPPSDNGTTIPSAPFIIDSGGNKWTWSGSTFDENGVARGGNYLLLYYNRNVYAENTGGYWYLWQPGVGWDYLGTTDPR